MGATTAEKTFATVAAVEAAAHAVWGGDWNHALSGREWAGSVDGRRSVLDAVERLGLHVATATSPHQIEDLLSFAGESRLSDHDAYVVEVASVTSVE
ncbi:hypothetical protein [Nocardioides psychrotolerans]|uniref:Endonuclease/Exonuclease/phosphatase family protein n=1 Tax=Nocardioides psychrotolerans TaxID=1005945 RepID=A0A1I3NWU7_9ACTN|nr:hypothetical protein [Nocardioides psychrotolerans]SFJ13748.1 hypothetical protein SAMN05216561_11917 [Nocardioides psychrotolerans]